MRILVTGCNGFIGNYICKALYDKGHIVIGTDLNECKVSKISSFISSDISSSSFLEDIKADISKCDCIVHTAAKISYNDFDGDLIIVNCCGAANVLKLAKDISCKKIVNISSSPIVGVPLSHPIDEYHPIYPSSLYHATKVMQEYVFGLSKKYGITSINIRVPSPIGIGMNPKTILSTFIECCLNNEPLVIMGNGSRMQDYIDVRDVANFTSLCVETTLSDDTFIAASENPISNIELAKKCIKISGSTSQMIIGTTPDPQDGIIWDYDCKHARSIGFSTKYTIDDTINDIITEKRNNY